MGSLNGYSKHGDDMPPILKRIQRHNEEHNERIDRHRAATIWDWGLMTLGYTLMKIGNKIIRMARIIQ